MARSNPVYVSQHNHFDPIWHRCWDRTFDFRGKRYQSYAAIEERVFNIWLENAKRGAVVTEGQSVVFRKYLDRNPDRLEEVHELVRKGLIELIACGETVADTNMPSGETLLRNLVMGQRYFEDTFGIIPTHGDLQDAFGQCGQMPQLFRGVECKSVGALSYCRVPGDYWKGIDGSVVFSKGFPHVKDVGEYNKIPPCADCGGLGCDKCADSGFDPKACHIKDEMISKALAESDAEPFSMVVVGGEEMIPNPRLPELVEEARAKLSVDFRTGYAVPLAKLFEREIASVDDPTLEVSEEVEGNPASTGCYVTRIRMKQTLRRVENLLNSAERWATVAHTLGADYPVKPLLEAWRNVVFACFHDAITSTYMDQPYIELLDMLGEAEYATSEVMDIALREIELEIDADSNKDYLMVYNSESWERNDPVTVTFANSVGVPTLKDKDGKVLEILDAAAEGLNVDVTFRAPKTPALGYSAVEVIPNQRIIDLGEVTVGAGQIENDFFLIKVGDKGVTSITDKRTGTEVVDTHRYLANELILEEDIGHPWGTTKAPSFEEGLGQYTTSVSIRKAKNASEITITGQYKGSDASVHILTWRQSINLYKDVDRIDFHTHIDWDTAQRRIRVAFPTTINTDDAMYAIPYGAVKRRKYAGNFEEGPSTNGDWPAINWVDVYSEEADRGVALINTGTPSHKVEDGVIFTSLLRSPTDSWVLNEPEYYDCPDFDGARDPGYHEFFYSLIPHPGDHQQANIERRGREINNPLVCRGLDASGNGPQGLSHSFLQIDASDNVIVTAFKKADRDDSVIVRIAETGGVPGEATVSIDGSKGKASLVNFLERHPEPVSGKIELGPYKIVTVRLDK